MNLHYQIRNCKPKKVKNQEKSLNSFESSLTKTPQSRKPDRDLLKKKSLKVKIEPENILSDGSFDILKSAKLNSGFNKSRLSSFIRGYSVEKKDRPDKINLVVPGLTDGSGKPATVKRAEYPRRYTFIANRKKSFTSEAKKIVDSNLNVPSICETEVSISVSQELKKQYDLFLNKQISLIQSKKRIQSQNAIFRTFQSLIQYL